MSATTEVEVGAVDISDLVVQICERIGVKSTLVYRLDIEPGSAEVHLYRVDERGRKFVVGADVPDACRNNPPAPLPEGWGGVACETRRFAVRA